MMDAPSRRIGLPWYTREDYSRIREMIIDPHNLAPTYDAWLAAAENNENVGRQAGLQIMRVTLEPDAFARWCREQGLQPDSAARTRYVAEVSAQSAG